MRLDLISSVFDDFFDERRGSVSGYRVDREKLEVEVPGYSREDLGVEVEGRELLIEGRKKGREFRKRFWLESGIDIDNLEVEVENGLLTIKLPSKKKRRKLL